MGQDDAPEPFGLTCDLTVESVKPLSSGRNACGESQILA